jgi:hypothetical protein
MEKKGGTAHPNKVQIHILVLFIFQMYNKNKISKRKTVAKSEEKYCL